MIFLKQIFKIKQNSKKIKKNFYLPLAQFKNFVSLQRI